MMLNCVKRRTKIDKILKIFKQVRVSFGASEQAQVENSENQESINLSLEKILQEIPDYNDEAYQSFMKNVESSLNINLQKYEQPTKIEKKAKAKDCKIHRKKIPLRKLKFWQMSSTICQI